ncbi:MAG TPA: low molecular weight protein arginine phosphatase [Longimicrobiaceae bacterium]|nr:low molecular weight protein arginine phosphatase [Longimicrobiaceae bacterium]
MAQDTDPQENPRTTTFNLVFVCTGNTCRSPLAEALARRELERRDWRHVQVASAGIAAVDGSPPSRNAAEVARRHGLDLSSHRSRPLTPGLLEWADLVLAMSPSHVYALERMGGGGKVALLSEFAAGPDGEGYPIHDPFGGDEEAYEATLQELQPLVGAVFDRLAPILHP